MDEKPMTREGLNPKCRLIILKPVDVDKCPFCGRPLDVEVDEEEFGPDVRSAR